MNSPTGSVATEQDANFQEFALWVFATAGLEVLPTHDSKYVVSMPENTGDRFSLGLREISFDAESSGDKAEHISAESPFLRQLLGELNAAEHLPDASPVHQPHSVREISQRLFDAYQVDGGSMHLSGCTLEEVPVLRLTLHDKTQGNRIRHAFISTGGKALDAELVDALKPAELAPHKPASRSAPSSRAQWLQTARRYVQGLPENQELLLVTAVWCRYAEGKVAFVIGESTAEVSFSSWAQLLADGIALPPPFQCGESGLSSRHLTATDDGRVTVVEAVARCSESGRRVLVKDLETCSVTGKAAHPEFFATCPVSGSRVLASELVACQMCQQQVSPATIQGGTCSACRRLQAVSKDDPRVARVLGEYPKLDRWPRWRIAETATAYILVAASLVRRMLLVVDKDSLEVSRLARSSRLSSRWTEASPVDRSDYLR